jgi:hypothetical protein
VPAENDPPPLAAAKPAGLAESAWWARVHRAAEREGLIGRRGVMSEWCHATLRVLGAAENRVELVEGGWQPIPPERCTEEYKAAETRRLNDELGRALGVGPMP